MTGADQEFIADRTKDFTGREWVFNEIDRWLADEEGPNFFLIAGEPGIGKSVIAARLTQVRDSAAFHFCIARNSETLDPLNFVRGLSLQLANRYQPFARALTELRHAQVTPTPFWAAPQGGKHHEDSTDDNR